VTRLAEVAAAARYRPGWTFRLHAGPTFTTGACRTPDLVTAATTTVAVWAGLPVLLVICAKVDDSSTGDPILLEHPFWVPPAEPACGWVRWLLDRCLDVDRHEACEWFEVGGRPPFYPEHGPGARLYEIVERTGTEQPLHREFRVTDADGNERRWYKPEPVTYLEP
jgi:hypothetical protein